MSWVRAPHRPFYIFKLKARRCHLQILLHFRNAREEFGKICSGIIN
nr:MAG TPA_asm: hypothetical protein [Caudoviricetes sp.]